jgi:hypothetical protein
MILESLRDVAEGIIVRVKVAFAALKRVITAMMIRRFAARRGRSINAK